MCCRSRPSSAGRPTCWWRRRRPAARSTSRRASSWRPGTWRTSSPRSARAGNDRVMVCERGASFGYNTLVSDMRALPILARTGCPGRLRRDAFGAAAGRQGHRVGRPARVRAGAGARGGRRRRRRGVHRDAPGPRQRPQRRPEHDPDEAVAGLLEMLLDLDRFAKAHPVAV